MNTPDQAILVAQHQVATRQRFKVGSCLFVVVTDYDVFIYPGPLNATQAYQAVRHKGSGTPPPGAVHWWTGGTKGRGHVTLGDYDPDFCYSTDFGPSGWLNDGLVHLTSVESISRHAPVLNYAGWSYDLNGQIVVPQTREAKVTLVRKEGVSTVYRYDVNHLQQVSVKQVRDALRLGAVLKDLPANDSVWDLPFDR